MYQHFTAEFFAGNRARLRQLFTGTAPIVITANGLLQSSADTNFLFRQDSNFWYLTGVNEPDFVLVIDKDKEYLIAPVTSRVQELFDDQAERDEVRQASGIKTILEAEEGWKQLGKRLKKSKHVATIAPPAKFIETYGFYTNPARAVVVKNIKGYNAQIELLDLSQHLARMRMIKQAPELAAIKQAIAITGRAIRKVQRQKHRFEYQVEASITNIFLLAGAVHGWPPVIASGPRACTIHHHGGPAEISNKELILVDVGAEVDRYCADITRTFAPQPPTKRQKQVYDAVKAAQEFAIELLKPGITIKQFEEQVEHFMGEKLRELGLIKSIDHETVRKYFPHATTHHLGLDAHDAADYKEPLAAGMVVTAEPGIYIPEEGIGVRLEDDVLITARGNKVLSASLPRKLH